MYRRLTCQVVGWHPGRAPWEFRGPHVGWALLLDRRRLRGPDPCLLRAWGGLRLPPVLKLFWCCLTMTVLQTLSSFPTDYSGVMLSLQVSSLARHGTAMGSSGAFRASQTRESAGWRPLWDDVQGGDRGLLHHPRCHLLLTSPPNCLVLLSRYLWPITKAGGTTCSRSPLNIWSQLLSVPGHSRLPAKGEWGVLLTNLTPYPCGVK